MWYTRLFTDTDPSAELTPPIPASTYSSYADAGRDPTNTFSDFRSAARAKDRTRKHLLRYKHFRGEVDPIDLPSHPNQRAHIRGWRNKNNELCVDYPPHHPHPDTGEIAPRVYLTKREAYAIAQWHVPDYYYYTSCSHPWCKKRRTEEKRLRKKEPRAQANVELDYMDQNLIYDLPRSYRYKYWRCCEYCQGSTPEVNEDGTILAYGSMDLAAWKKMHNNGGFEAQCLKGMAQELFSKDDNSTFKISGTDALCLDAAPKVSAAEFLESDAFAFSDSWLAFRDPDEVTDDKSDDEEARDELYNMKDSDINLTTYINYILRHARATLSTLIHTVPHNAATGITAFWAAVIIRGLQTAKIAIHTDPIYPDRTDPDRAGRVRNATGCWDTDYAWCAPDPCQCEWCTEEMKVQWDPAARVQTWWLGALIGDEVWDDMVHADRKWEVQGLMRDEWDVGSLAGSCSDVDDDFDDDDGWEEVETWTFV